MIEMLSMRRLGPGVFGLRKWAMRGTFAEGAVAIDEGIYHDAFGPALKKSLRKCCYVRIGQAGADGDLYRNIGFAGGTYQLPAPLQRRPAAESLKVGLIVGFDGDGEPGVGNLA